MPIETLPFDLKSRFGSRFNSLLERGLLCLPPHLAVNSDSLPMANGKWQNLIIDYYHGQGLTDSKQAAHLNKEKE